ncbi:MAG: glucosidase, partial [Phycisphaerales bacterium]|nr:glucosidase [Phycisphaerales bacterium]
MPRKPANAAETARSPVAPAPDTGSGPSVRRTAEHARLAEAETGGRAWRRWGPYLAERHWGTVREDYSADGDCWSYLPHDHARSRAYRWGEDGLLGISDDQGELCFALALWNGKDPILKERLFGLTGPEGNHGEDVKEHYFYLDSTPTHSYMKALYKYPLAAFPYERLVRENASRGRDEPEFELADTGVLDHGAYVDVQAEYAKAGPDDILVLLTLTNRSAQPADLHVLPTLWFRNTWSWGLENAPPRPRMSADGDACLLAQHARLGAYRLWFEPDAGAAPELLFTENESNARRLWGAPNAAPHVKDAFHERVVDGRIEAVNADRAGTKAAPWFRLAITPGGTATIRLRLTKGAEPPNPSGAAGAFRDFDAILDTRRREADEFYEALGQSRLGAPAARAWRQAFAGLLWSKQFYHYWIPEWLDGDPACPAPPQSRMRGRNAQWRHLNNADIISMPDKWEYPWYAAWDLAFHTIPLAQVDPEFAKDQLVLLLREWYMHPSGQIPAYEFAFDDVNPPVHAWACWRVYKMTAPRGQRDRAFLARTFMKLLLNFTWWVNRKDPEGNNVFAGGFLGLDNIGVF